LTLIDFHSKKYQDGFISLVLKSLAYFDDADEQGMPFMFHSTSCQTMKNNIKKALADYILPGGEFNHLIPFIQSKTLQFGNLIPVLHEKS